MQFFLRLVSRWIIRAVCLMAPFSLLAQFTVTYPVSRMVLQRDNANQASVQIAGSYALPIDRVDAQVVPMVSGQGTPTSWSVIQTNPTNGQFNGTLPVQGGWYRLRVRAMKNGVVVGTDSVDRVGVGEVFGILGHSNAQGSSCADANGFDRCATITGAADDRVICVGIDPVSADFQRYQSTGSSNYLPGLLFSKLNTFSGISPFHSFSWVWGRLGDLLTARLNVPVLFYGAGFGGTNMEQVYKAAYDIPFPHSFVRYDIRMPFANVRTIMKLYVPSTGIRSFLIVHGENDRYDGGGDTLQTHKLFKMYLEQVQAKMRTEFQRPNLAWVVALTSYPNPDANNSAYLFPEVRNAEKEFVAHSTNTFLGPDIDSLRLPADRPDGIHYATSAQEKVAALWSRALNTQFFQNSTPYPAQPQPLASLTCATGNQLALTQPAGFGAYLWSNGTTTATLTAGPGTYSARLRRSMAGADSNVIFFPPPIVVPAQVMPLTPTITYGANPLICGGESLTLTSSYTVGPNLWSTASTASSITIPSPGTYTVRAAHPVYGCLSNIASQSVSTGKADLSLNWKVSNRTPVVGQPLTLSLTVRNDGPCNVSNVTVINRLPPNIRFDSSASFALVGTATDVLSTTLPAILSNQSVSRQYIAHATAAGQYYNATEITASSSPDPDSQAGSGTADGQDDAATVDFRTRDGGTGLFVSPNPNQVPLPPVASNQPKPDTALADLSLFISASKRVISPGQPVSFTITVRNRGGATATNITIRDVLPTGLQFVSAPAGVSSVSGVVSGTIGQLPAGQEASLSFTTSVTSGTFIQTSAQIMNATPGDPDSTPGNGTTNGEDDTATTDLRVSSGLSGARMAAPGADASAGAAPNVGLPVRRRTIRQLAVRPN